MSAPFRHGFTLLELSLVLVIIGLLVGGVLVGRDLINAAAIRSQIAQLEQYNTAANTFKIKYGGLPGDIPEPHASAFGFLARGQYAGQGDGNGVLEGAASNAANSNKRVAQGMGENTVFWRDFSQAGMIGGKYTIASSTAVIPSTWSAEPDGILPEAKLGAGNFIYVYSGGWGNSCYGTVMPDEKNYFGIVKAKGNRFNSSGKINSFNSTGDVYWEPGLTVLQASTIDTKIDDGYPQSGSVQANYAYQYGVCWARGNGGASGGNFGAEGWPITGPTTTATAYNAINCYDNNGVAGAKQQYSMLNASTVNCALSFQFK